MDPHFHIVEGRTPHPLNKRGESRVVHKAGMTRDHQKQAGETATQFSYGEKWVGGSYVAGEWAVGWAGWLMVMGSISHGCSGCALQTRKTRQN